MYPCPAELCRFLFQPSESGCQSCPSTPPRAKQRPDVETPEGKPRYRVSTKRPLCDLKCPPGQRSKPADDTGTAAECLPTGSQDVKQTQEDHDVM
jgi:hypothetical protein